MVTFQHELEKLIESINPETHQNLKTAIELGRWSNGERLSKEQISLCMQAVIAFDERYMHAQDRVAYIDRSKIKK